MEFSGWLSKNIVFKNLKKTKMSYLSKNTIQEKKPSKTVIYALYGARVSSLLYSQKYVHLALRG